MAWCRLGDKSYLDQLWLVYCPIYASLGLNELCLLRFIAIIYATMKHTAFTQLVSLLVGSPSPLPWRHNECEGVTNHQHLDCLLSRLYRLISKQASKLCVTGLCEGNPLVTGGFPSTGPVTRKMFPFNDVIIHKSDDFLTWLGEKFHELCFDCMWTGLDSVHVPLGFIYRANFLVALIVCTESGLIWFSAPFYRRVLWVSSYVYFNNVKFIAPIRYCNTD